VVGCVFNGSLKKGQPPPTAKTSLCELEVVRTIETSVFLMNKKQHASKCDYGYAWYFMCTITIACTRACLICVVSIKGHVHSPQVIANFFGSIVHFSIEAPLWTPVTKWIQICLPLPYLFSLHTWELNFGQTIWDKIEVRLWTTWELEEPCENMMRTHWEQGKKQEITPPTPPPKENIGPHHEHMLSLLIGCMKFLFPKTLVIIFGLG
jgi:hypothetical protein